MSKASDFRDSDNELLRYFSIVRPKLWDEDELQKTAFLIHHAIASSKTVDWDDLTDALAELIPEKREYWLRVQATWNDHFCKAMTAMFSEEDLTDEPSN